MKEYEVPVQSIPKDKRFCKRCGEIKRLKYFPEDGEFCDACCKEMLHAHPRWYVYPALVIVLALVAAAVYLAVLSVPAARLVHESGTYAEQHRLYDAYDKLEEAEALMSKKETALVEKVPKLAVFNWFNAGFRPLVNRYALMAETDTNIETGYAIQDEILIDELTAGQKKYFKKYLDICAVYEDISDKLGKITDEYEVESPEDVPLDEMLAKLDTIAKKDPSSMKSGYVEYYKASVIQYVNSGDLEDALPHLEKMMTYMPDEYAMYLSSLYSFGRTTGDYGKLITECDKVIAKNLNSISAYSLKTRGQMNSGDYAAAEKTCEQLKKYNGDCPEYYALLLINKLRQKDLKGADAVSYQGDTANSEFVDAVFKQYLGKTADVSRHSENIFLQSFDFTMCQAAVMLLQKDYSGARDLMYNYGYTYAYYYSYLTGGQEPVTQGLIDMLYLSAYLDKDSETMDTVTSQLGNYSDNVQNIIDGKLTLQEVFEEGKVDLF